MKFMERVLFLVAGRNGVGNRLFELDENVHLALVNMAAQEQRPPGELQADLLMSALAQRETAHALWRRWQSLSPREQQSGALACLGYTNRQIAARLGVAEETVKTHIRNALVKFNLHGKAELRMALREWDFSNWE